MHQSRKLTKKRRLAMLALLTLAASPLLGATDQGAEQVPVVGLDQNHQPIEALIPASEYRKQLSGVITSLHESTARVLAARVPKPGWFLRNVAVGFALGLQAGLGPVVSLGAQSEFLLVYTNKVDATIP